MLYALLLLAPAYALQSPPSCSVTGENIASRKSEVLAEVLRILPGTMADRGEPFQATDVAENNPTTRLICGYASEDGYMIEREHGGRGYHVERLHFRKTADGYVVG